MAIRLMEVLQNEKRLNFAFQINFNYPTSEKEDGLISVFCN